jgi:mRNA interferase MazF
VKRGEVWVANLNPTRGRAFGKIRPVLIVHADELIAAGSPVIVVLPVTSKVRAGLHLLRVTIPSRDRLREPGQVVVDQPRSLDRTRLGEGPLTRLSAAEMRAVDRGLRVALGLC